LYDVDKISKIYITLQFTSSISQFPANILWQYIITPNFKINYLFKIL